MPRRVTQDIEDDLPDQTNILTPGRLYITLLALASSLFVVFMDQNGIGIMTPAIAVDLNAHNTISWAGTASTLSSTIFQLNMGRLSELFGRKKVFLSAVALQLLGSLGSGLAVNSAMLYAFRGVSGLGGGGIISLASIFVSDIVTLEQRGKYQGILGTTVGMGSLAGPFIGAAFAEDVTWRAFFWLLAPLTFVCLVMDWRMIPPTVAKKDFRGNVKNIDFLGIFCASTALICLLVPISGGGSYMEWDSPLVIALLSIGGFMAAAFIFVEAKVSRLPVMPMSLYKNPATCVLLIQNIFYGAVYHSCSYFLPLYFQNVRGFNPVIASLFLAPIVVFQCLSVGLSGLYISRFQRYGEVIWLGFLLWTLGISLLLLFDRDTHAAVLVIVASCIGAGSGLVFQPTIIAMQAHTRKAMRAVVISNRNFLRGLGGSAGLALSSAILQDTFSKHLPGRLKFLASHAYTTPNESRYDEADLEALLDAHCAAAKMVFISFIPLMAVCLLSYVVVKDYGLSRPDENVDDDELESWVVEESGSSNDAVVVADPDTSPAPGMEKLKVGGAVTDSNSVSTAEGQARNTEPQVAIPDKRGPVVRFVNHRCRVFY